MKRQKMDDLQLSLFSDADFGVTTETASAAGHVGATLATSQDDTASATGHAETAAATSQDELPESHYDLSSLFERLSKSTFRSHFHLKAKDREYIDKKGLDVIRQHAADFVAKRLAPAVIPNDGQQTPMRGHPVFIAQHATGCCCRGCFCKWHHIPPGRALSPVEQAYAVEVLMTWIQREYDNKVN